jgi:hypothetical protein
MTVHTPTSSSVRWIAPGLLIAMVACSGEGDDVAPDGVWNITVESSIIDSSGVESLDSTCIGEDGAARVYNETFQYDLYYDGSAVQIDVDGQIFANGSRAGCGLSYESSIWLEDRAAGRVTWYVEGSARYRGTAGGCDNEVEQGSDWSGTETIIVVDSEDESIPIGCEYNLVTSGTVVSGG